MKPPPSLRDHEMKVTSVTTPPLLVSQALDLCLTLFSGRTGAKLGRAVPFNLTGQGKLIGPLLHETQQGAYYILFGLGNGITRASRTDLQSACGLSCWFSCEGTNGNI